MAEEKELLRSKHAFGSSENIDVALESSAIDAYDILFLDGETAEPKIGWIDKNGNKVIIKDRKQIIFVDSDALPSEGALDSVYIFNNKFYYWDGLEFKTPTVEGNVTESIVDTKIKTATQEAKSYTDEKVASVEQSIMVVEF